MFQTLLTNIKLGSNAFSKDKHYNLFVNDDSGKEKKFNSSLLL
jgi:hypothetical protein